MKDKLTKKEISKLERLFSPEDIEKIIKEFGVQDIKKVINHPCLEN